MQLQYFWDPVNNNAVCLSQAIDVNTLVPIPITINGSLANQVNENNVVDFSRFGYSRALKIVISDISGEAGVTHFSSLTLTISGTQNQAAASFIVGGDYGIEWPSRVSGVITVITSSSFDVVNTVTMTGVNQSLGVKFTIKIGTAKSGYFNAIDIANNVDPASHVYSLAFRSTGLQGVTYTIYEAVEDILNGNYDDLIATGTFMKPNINNNPNPIAPNPVTGVTKLMQLNDICSYLLVRVASQADDDTLALDFLSLQ